MYFADLNIFYYQPRKKSWAQTGVFFYFDEYSNGHVFMFSRFVGYLDGFLSFWRVFFRLARFAMRLEIESDLLRYIERDNLPPFPPCVDHGDGDNVRTIRNSLSQIKGFSVHVRQINNVRLP